MSRFLGLLSVFILLSGSSFARDVDTFSVFFNLDDPFLNTAAEKKLEKIAQKIDASENILIIGYADYLGDVYYNDMLALRRAQNVAVYLEKSGVDRSLLKTIISRGEIERDKERPGGYWQDRRVDIVAKSKPKDLPRPAPPPPKPVPPSPPPVAKDTAKILTKESIEAADVGNTLKIPNLYFVGGRDIFRPGAEQTLEQLYEILDADTSLKIQIEGHICCVYGEGDGQDLATGQINLSWMRAKAVYDYLVGKGIDESRLKYIGLGHKHPVALDESSQYNADLNRRVEIRILDKKQ
jgi:outer membrane protein OmpA-like peptidoglycan-associated protein